MIRYTSTGQLKIEEFKTPFEINIEKHIDNRWVRLANSLPWDKLAKVYYSKMCKDNGAPAKSARLVIGALIVKGMLKLSDRETMEMIRENCFIQYFLGMSAYSYEYPFDRTLLTKIRKRIGIEEYDLMSRELLKIAEMVERGEEERIKEGAGDKFKKQEEKIKGDKGIKNGGEGIGSKGSRIEREMVKEGDEIELKESQVKREDKEDKREVITDKDETKKKEELNKQNKELEKEKEKEKGKSHQEKHKGKLIIDATVMEQQIAYPNDLGLLNKCREESERLIDELHKIVKWEKKPRTYRQEARKKYLMIAKKKRKSEKEIRRGIKEQLGYLRRNISHINKMLDELERRGIKGWVLSYRDLRIFWVIQEVYRQQEEMYKEKKRRIEDRIVNIYQPYVRPMVRGKEGKEVEFGSKASVSLIGRMSFINRLSWDAYNEGIDLKGQVERYKALMGYYPEVVIADKIYGTRENREYLRERGIRFSGNALGRPKEEEKSKEEKRKEKKERGIRNRIEGKFGQGKNGYGLGKIRAKTKETSESWIGNIFFVMNIVSLMKILVEKGINFLFLFFSIIFGWVMRLRVVMTRTIKIYQLYQKNFPSKILLSTT
jgi:IS5 family transposase